jgi:hypothetical protein
VLIHAFGLVLIRDQVVLELRVLLHPRRSSIVLVVIAAVTVLPLTLLHAAEASAWAGAYVALGARPDFASAMLYSLSAMTSYGHANVYLAEHWQLMGGPRGAERYAAVRPVDGVPIRRASATLACAVT